MKRPDLLRAAAIASLAAAGCQHVVYVSDTNIGVNITAAAQGTPKIVLGYDRETFAQVPRYDPGADGSQAEAMSLVSVSNIDSTGLEELIFNHYIATGAAADKAAEEPTALRMMRKAVLGEAGQ